jgi:hypothetical protein
MEACACSISWSRPLAPSPTAAWSCPVKPGSELAWTWRGRTYRVVVTADRFAHEGTTYSGLSVNASEITATKWNGPRFFGLRSASTKSIGGDDGCAGVLAALGFA